MWRIIAILFMGILSTNADTPGKTRMCPGFECSPEQWAAPDPYVDTYEPAPEGTPRASFRYESIKAGVPTGSSAEWKSTEKTMQHAATTYVPPSFPFHTSALPGGAALIYFADSTALTQGITTFINGVPLLKIRVFSWTLSASSPTGSVFTLRDSTHAVTICNSVGSCKDTGYYALPAGAALEIYTADASVTLTGFVIITLST